jgi:hypothetical protein
VTSKVNDCLASNMDWIKHHEFLAALIGAIIGFTTLVSRSTKPPAGGTVKTVRVIILFFVFALEATIALSPAAGIGTQIFSGLTAFASLSGSFIARGR